MKHSQDEDDFDDMNAKYFSYVLIVLVEAGLVFALAYVFDQRLTWRLCCFVIGLLLVLGYGDDLARRARHHFHNIQGKQG